MRARERKRVSIGTSEASVLHPRGKECILKALTLGGHPVTNKLVTLGDELISGFIIILPDPNSYSVARKF